MGLFGVYLARAGGSHDEEVELVEPARTIAALPKRTRRLALVGLFLFSAAMILMAAEPFAEGLVESGTSLGIDEFLLVQWLAPLASEAPEIIIAAILVLRGRANIALAMLISSKGEPVDAAGGDAAGGVRDIGRVLGAAAAGLAARWRRSSSRRRSRCSPLC